MLTHKLRGDLLPKRQALLHLSVNIPVFTLAQARRFGQPTLLSDSANNQNMHFYSRKGEFMNLLLPFVPLLHKAGTIHELPLQPAR
jgi:hypothetical protein